MAGIRPNRHDLEVVWSKAGDLVLVNHTYRWDCVMFCAVSMIDGRPGHELDLNKQLGDAVRTFVAKSSADFPGSKSDLNVAFSGLKQNSDTRFSVHADDGHGQGMGERRSEYRIHARSFEQGNDGKGARHSRTPREAMRRKGCCSSWRWSRSPSFALISAPGWTASPSMSRITSWPVPRMCALAISVSIRSIRR